MRPSSLLLLLSPMAPQDASDGQNEYHISLKHAAVGGAVVAVVMGGIALAVGLVGAGEARRLLQDTLPTTRFMCYAVMTTSATTLALMLTLVSLSTDDDRSLKSTHFQRIRRIALLAVVVFVGATVLLAAHAFPFGEAASIPSGWYVALYYVITGGAALLGGTIVSVMIILYTAARDLIVTLDPGTEAHPVEEDSA